MPHLPAVLCVLALLALAACGIKGPLRHPNPLPAVKSAPAEPSAQSAPLSDGNKSL